MPALPTRRICLALGLFLLLGAPHASAQAPRRNLCAVFTTAEVAKPLGTGVDAGEPAAMGTGCQWFGKD